MTRCNLCPETNPAKLIDYPALIGGADTVALCEQHFCAGCCPIARHIGIRAGCTTQPDPHFQSVKRWIENQPPGFWESFKRGTQP